MNMVRCSANLSHSLIVSCLILDAGNSTSCETHPSLIIYHSDAAWVALRELPTGYPSLDSLNHPCMPPPKEVYPRLNACEYCHGSSVPLT
jgi:hypothetical protein